MAVFLSYAREDRERVEELRRELDDLRGPVWFDARLTGGQKWWDEILRQIRGSDLLVLAVTEGSLRSEACIAETRYAIAVDRPFVGVRLGELELAGADEMLRRTQLVDFTTRDIDSVKALARAVLTTGPPRPLPDPLPDAPPVPVSYADRFADLFAPRLDIDQQLGILARLRFDMETGRNARQAAELLSVLRERPDVSWRVRQEIEVLSADAPPGNARPDGDDTSSIGFGPGHLLRTSRSGRWISIPVRDGSVILHYRCAYAWGRSNYRAVVELDNETIHDGASSPMYLLHPRLGGQVVELVLHVDHDWEWVRPGFRTKVPITAFSVTVDDELIYSE